MNLETVIRITEGPKGDLRKVEAIDGDTVIHLPCTGAERIYPVNGVGQVSLTLYAPRVEVVNE